MAETEAYPVDAVAAKTAEMSVSKEADYDKAKDPNGYWKIFQKFDEDGSGAVDFDEMKKMVASLGMIVKDDDLKQMIEDADEDKSGEIEFNEFVTIIRTAAAQGAQGKGGESFASIINRQANSVQMGWRADRLGDKVKYDKDADPMTVSRSGEGFGVALLDQWMPGDMKLFKGSAILSVSCPKDAYVWVGLVGRNFNPEGEWYNQEFFNIKNEKRMITTAVCSKDGAMYLNGAEMDKSTRFTKFGAAPPEGKPAQRISLQIDVSQKECQFATMDSKGELDYSIVVENIKNEVGIAVCFGPTKEGETSVVQLIGSSCEKTEKKTRRSSKELWDEDNVVGMNDKEIGGVNAGELNGA